MPTGRFLRMRSAFGARVYRRRDDRMPEPVFGTRSFVTSEAIGTSPVVGIFQWVIRPPRINLVTRHEAEARGMLNAIRGKAAKQVQK